MEFHGHPAPTNSENMTPISLPLFGIFLCLHLHFAIAAPAVDVSLNDRAAAATSILTSSASTPTVPFASDDPNVVLWGPNDNVTPEPIRGSLGGNILAAQNIPMELQNADLLAPPTVGVFE